MKANKNGQDKNTVFSDARRDYYKSLVKGYFEEKERMGILMGTWRNF